MKLYSTDNGRLVCTSHLGASARATGHDISGQKISVVTKDDIAAAKQEYGVEFACETCGWKPTLDIRWMHNGISLIHAFKGKSKSVGGRFGSSLCGMRVTDGGLLGSDWRAPADSFVRAHISDPKVVCDTCLTEVRDRGGAR